MEQFGLKAIRKADYSDLVYWLQEKQAKAVLSQYVTHRLDQSKPV